MSTIQDIATHFRNKKNEKDYERKSKESEKRIKAQFENRISGLSKQVKIGQQRIDQLEKRLKTAKQSKCTLGQKMLILEFLGAISTTERLKISSNSRMKLLSYLLDAHIKAVEPAFNGRSRTLGSNLSIAPNYVFLINLFTEIGLSGEAEKAEDFLNKIRSNKEKLKSSKKGVTP